MAEENQIDLENLSITELAQLSQHVNSGNFPTSQRQKVEALVWRKIKSVADRASKLDPQNKDELQAFQSMLDGLPLAYRMETGGLLPTVKSAETRLYNAKNGIDDRSMTEKAKDNLNEFGNNLHQKYSDMYDRMDDKVNAWVNTAGEKIEAFENGVKNAPKKAVAKLKHNAQVGHRFMRLAANKTKNQSKNWLKAKHQGYSEWYDRTDDKLNAWVDKAGQKIEAFENGVRAVPGMIKDRIVEGYERGKEAYLKAQEAQRKRDELRRQRRREQVAKLKHNAKLGYRFMRLAANKTKNQSKNWIKNKKQGYDRWADRMDDKLNAWVDKAGKKIEAFEKGLDKGIDNAAAGMSKAVKTVGKGVVAAGAYGFKQMKRGWQKMGNVINGIKLPSVKGRAGEKGSALDLANGDLSKLKPEQIKNVYNELKQHRDKPRGDKYGDAYYKISAYSTELLNEIKAKGAGAITDDNAGKVAAWLEVNKNIQQEVNKNRAKENEDRNAEIEGFLKNRKPKEKDEKKQENKQERTEQKHTGLAAEYEDFANSMGKKVDAAFLRDCWEGKYKNDFEQFVTAQREKYGPKKQQESAANTQMPEPRTAETRTAEAAAKPKDMYEGLNLSDAQKKTIDGEFNQLKDVYDNPDKWNLADSKNKDIVLNTYKESLKQQGLDDNQVRELMSRQRESVKDNPQYQDMFRADSAKRDAAKERVGLNDAENNTGVDRLAEKARTIQEKRGVVEPKKSKVIHMDTSRQQQDTSKKDTKIIEMYGRERA